MTPPLSYLGFHLVFILPPIALLGWLAVRREGTGQTRGARSGVAIIVFLAVVYTTPWTNTLIPEGVWWYGDGAVVATLWHTPVEEYLFFVLQPVMTALWLVQFSKVADLSLRIPRAHRIAGAVGGLTVGAVGWALLGSTETYYLGAILFWAGPILAIQWAFGITYLIRIWKQLVVIIGVPTVYLWIADAIAISLGIWTISDAHTVGIAVAGLPIEEALFFLVTNLFVVQGITLYLWLLDRRHELPAIARLPWLDERVRSTSANG